MPLFDPKNKRGDHYRPLESAIEELLAVVNQLPKTHSIHTGNIFNKQIGHMLSDLSCVRIITHRIETGSDSEEINLDIKSFQVFGKMLIESVLYLCKLFLPTQNISWSKLGVFLRTAKEFSSRENDQFSKFWHISQSVFEQLQEKFSYRNYIIHNKKSTIEWTFIWPGHNNLDNCYIEHIPWKDGPSAENAKSYPLRVLVITLNEKLSSILNYLKDQITSGK